MQQECSCSACCSSRWLSFPGAGRRPRRQARDTMADRAARSTAAVGTAATGTAAVGAAATGIAAVGAQTQEAQQDDLRRALMKARRPVPACAVMKALRQNPDAGADEVMNKLFDGAKYIESNRVTCFLCRCGMAAIDWMPHTRGCKLKAKCAGPSALPKAAGLVSVDPDTVVAPLNSKVAPKKVRFDRTPSPPWTPRRHQEMGHPAGPLCADIPLPKWFSLIQL